MEYNVKMVPNALGEEITIDIEEVGYTLEEWNNMSVSEKETAIREYTKDWELGFIGWVSSTITNKETGEEL